MTASPDPHTLPGTAAVIASAGADGVPHLALGMVDGASASHLEVSGWLCPQTLANLEGNPRVAVAVDPGGPLGFQLLGTVTEKSVGAVRRPGAAEDAAAPRVKYRLVVRIEATLALTDQPHTDQPLA